MQAPRLAYVLRSVDHPTILSMRHADITYVVGFLRSHDALHVARTIPTLPQMRLQKYKPVNVRQTVQRGVDEVGLDKPVKVTDIYIDEDAVLRVNKQNIVQVQRDWLVAKDTYANMISYPFNKNLGIAVIKNKLGENTDALYYECEVVQPVFDPELFRKSLLQ